MSPSSGSGTGTPIVCGVGSDLSIAQEYKTTLLSLPYFARLMGINPVHFAGATGGEVFPITSNSCNDVWPRWSWQSADRVSHEDLAHAIYDAEQDIARALGYYPAPYWIAQEVHKYPRHYRPDVWSADGTNVRGAGKSIKLEFGKFIQGGRRAVTLVGTATTVGGSLSYTDEDGDGFCETATVTVPTTLTDECELKVYHHGGDGRQGWEIRPPRSKTITGGSFVGVFDSWLFIDPDLFGAYPTIAGFTAIDISTVANFVVSVDVYREYNDYSQAAATFYWEPSNRPAVGCFCQICGGLGCPACSLTAQDGCVHARDTELGLVVPQPATYDDDDADWGLASFTDCREPDEVKISYYAGHIDNDWRRGVSCEMLSNYWAHAIAWLAVARLERPFCSCGNVLALAEHLREDLALNSREKSYQLQMDALDNPFGSKRGEVQAWLRVKKYTNRHISGGCI